MSAIFADVSKNLSFHISWTVYCMKMVDPSMERYYLATFGKWVVSTCFFRWRQHFLSKNITKNYVTWRVVTSLCNIFLSLQYFSVQTSKYSSRRWLFSTIWPSFTNLTGPTGNSRVLPTISCKSFCMVQMLSVENISFLTPAASLTLFGYGPRNRCFCFADCSRCYSLFRH